MIDFDYPNPLNPDIEQKELKLSSYGRIGNSYRFTDDRFIIMKGGARYEIDFAAVGDATRIRTTTDRCHTLDDYVLDAEYYRLLDEGISLSHVSTVAKDGAIVLTGPPNAGKTGVAMAMIKNGYRFMADENAPLTSEGKAKPLELPVAVGRRNIHRFKELLSDLDVEYSRAKARFHRVTEKLSLPLVDKAMDRFVDPLSVDFGPVQHDKPEQITMACYIQPEDRDDIVVESMEASEFCYRLSLWNQMHRESFQQLYHIWRTENDEVNEDIVQADKKEGKTMRNCFADVAIKKVRVPLKRQPKNIAQIIDELS